MVQFGKYTLLEKLAEGGMAEIFLAAHTGPGGFAKLVVIKRILPKLEVSPEFQQMLLDEARIAATLNHPNIVQTFEVDTVGESLFIAMEHLVGEDVRALTQALREPLPLGAALSLLFETCKGLTYAHEKTFGGDPLGIVHRDLSPRNLFITYDGNVKILDFGVARARDRLSHTRTGEIKGSLPYMSPEQVRSSRDIDHRSDLFTLGTLLWELTTGERLFRGNADYDVLRRIAIEPIPRPSEVVQGYPAELEAVVMRLLQRDPADRYPGCRELQAELEELALKLGVRTGSLVLSGLMTRLFPERIARARELERDLPSRLALQDQRAGLPRPAAAAVEATGELTVNERAGRSGRRSAGDASAVTRSDRVAGERAPTDRVASSSMVAAAIERGPEAATARRRSPVRVLGLVALGVGGLVALGSWLATPARSGKVAGGSPAVGSVRPPPPPAPEVPPPRPAPPAEVVAAAAAGADGGESPAAPPATPADAGAARVSVDLETVPAGAEVWRDGRRVGTTPVQLSLPRTSGPVRLRLERRGHLAEELEVATSGDRRILRHLRRRGSSVVPPRARRGAPASARPRRGSGPDDLVDPFR